MRDLFDANVISNVTKSALSQSLLAWTAERGDEELFIAALTVAEIRRGVLKKPAGRRRGQLEAWFTGPEGPRALFAGRILSFNETAGEPPSLWWTALIGFQGGEVGTVARG